MSHHHRRLDQLAQRPARRLVLTAAAIAALVVFDAQAAMAGGFEIPENTTKSVARGGTGAVNKRDPSALYFNPALLERADGLQVLVNLNVLNLQLEFDRSPMTYQESERRPPVERTFDPIRNEAGLFPAPFLTASWDMGLENLTVGMGIFGPSSYGRRCFGEQTADGCQTDREASARYMIVDSDIIEFYASLGAGYRLELPAGALSFGATAMATRLDANFSLAIHGTLQDEDHEEPDNDAIFTGRDMSDWAFTGTVGLAYELSGFRLGASYRPPISWEAHGTAKIESDLGLALSDDGVTLETEQAGSLRAGIGYEGGTHPGDARLPRFDVEFNFVWEDWSRTQHFKTTPDGKLYDSLDLGTFYQTKGYQDTYSFRLGGSWAFNEWLTGHTGGYYESAAQSVEYTAVDWVSWDRYAMGLGATLNILDGWDFDLAYMHVLSPSRQVNNGQIYHKVPLSSCSGPDYTDEQCDEQGTPPGNPQNNGTWSSSFQIASVGFTYRYE